MCLCEQTAVRNQLIHVVVFARLNTPAKLHILFMFLRLHSGRERFGLQKMCYLSLFLFCIHFLNSCNPCHWNSMSMGIHEIETKRTAVGGNNATPALNNNSMFCHGRR